MIDCVGDHGVAQVTPLLFLQNQKGEKKKEVIYWLLPFPGHLVQVSPIAIALQWLQVHL
jgi:hypothetical protein